MSRPGPRIRRRLLPVTIAVAAAALALTGCQPGELAPSESPQPSGSASPAPTVSETPEPTEPGRTETPGDSTPPDVTTPPVAGELACSDVLTADQLYAFSPNFAPAPETGTLPGTIGAIADAGGTVCAYQHVTGSDRLVVAVLQGLGEFDAPAFETVGDEGVATLETSDAVISVASVYFPTAADAQPVLDEIAANLG